MAKEKYYGTNIMYHVPNAVLEKYNATNHHKQFRIACKAKSKAEAERIVQSILNVTWNVFRNNYVMETGNPEEIEKCDKYTAIINLNNNGPRFYVSLKEIYEEVKAHNKTIK